MKMSLFCRLLQSEFVVYGGLDAKLLPASLKHSFSLNETFVLNKDNRLENIFGNLNWG